MSHRRLFLTGSCIGAVTAGLILATSLDMSGNGGPAHSGKSPPGGPGPGAGEGESADGYGGGYAEGPAVGAFLGSETAGVRRIPQLERWLGGKKLRVGHTYLPGDLWANIEGKPEFLAPWAEWRKAEAERLFVLNVPMLERNEAGVPDAEVGRLLRSGAEGRFDRHFRTLAERLVALGVPDTVIVLGWEMNGTTYTHRCAPDPEAWKTYWRSIVTTMRAVPGQDFRFDFAPSRGRDAIGWTECYPGDEYVDIIGMDSYDQPPGRTFEEQIEQPFGLRKQVEFAETHGKPISYPEWGLFRDGDNPGYVRQMLDWMEKHPPVYHTITDYCPHGVWQCEENPKSSRVFRSLMAPDDESSPEPSPEPTVPSLPTKPPRPAEPTPVPEPTPPGKPGWKPEPDGQRFCLNLGNWVEQWLGGPLCFRVGWDW